MVEDGLFPHLGNTNNIVKLYRAILFYYHFPLAFQKLPERQGTCPGISVQALSHCHAVTEFLN